MLIKNKVFYSLIPRSMETRLHVLVVVLLEFKATCSMDR